MTHYDALPLHKLTNLLHDAFSFVFMLFPFVHKELPVAVLKLRDYMEQKVCAHMKKTEDKNSSKKAVKRNPYRDEAIKR